MSSDLAALISDPATVQPIIDRLAIHKGYPVTKVCSNGARKPKTLYVDKEKAILTYVPSFKSVRTCSIDLSHVVDVVRDEYAEWKLFAVRLALDPEGKKYWSFAVNSLAERESFLAAMSVLVERAKADRRVTLIVKCFENWPRNAQGQKEREISLEAIRELLDRVVGDTDGLASSEWDELFRVYDKDGSGAMGFQELAVMLQATWHAKAMQPVYDTMRSHTSNANSTWSPETLLHFIQKVQGDSKTSPETAADLVTQFTSSRGVPRLSFADFSSFIFDPVVNGPLRHPKGGALSGTPTEDMRFFFREYMIYTAHGFVPPIDAAVEAAVNSTKLPDPLPKRYARALTQGVRCLEIPYWDGPTAESDPLATPPGHPQRCTLRDVLREVEAVLFTASPMPVFLVLQAMTGTVSQLVNANRVARSLLSSKLVDPAKLREKHCSPSEWQEKVFLVMRTKEGVVTAPAPAVRAICYLQRLKNPVEAMLEGGARGEAAPGGPPAAAGGESGSSSAHTDEDGQMAIHTLSDPREALSKYDWTGIRSRVRDGRLGDTINGLMHPALMRAKLAGQQSPLLYFAAGFQFSSVNMTSMPNAQGVGAAPSPAPFPSAVVRAIFAQNGGCGYVHRDLGQRLRVNLTVISGRRIAVRSEGADVEAAIIVRLYGNANDNARPRQKTQPAVTAGFEPMWNQPMEFETTDHALAVLHFQVEVTKITDGAEDAAKGADLGRSRRERRVEITADGAIPLRSTRLGYRTLQLWEVSDQMSDGTATPVRAGLLLVHLEMIPA